MAEIILKDVTKTIGRTAILDMVSLTIPDKSFVVIVGPSGCGKTTTLRLIAGLEEPTSGDVIIDGRPVNDLLPREREISMVFQNYALYPHMTVKRNLGFGLTVRKTPKESIETRIREVAEMLGIYNLLDRKPNELSGGEKQRVAIGRAIIRNPKAFLFDEPLSNLDARLRVQMRSEIKKLHHRLGATIIFVTHDQVEAMTLADIVVVMNKGRIVQVGSPADVYHNPVDVFAATFIGSPSMNLVNSRVFSNGSGISVDVFGERIPLNSNIYDIHDGQDVLIGIRPEHLSAQTEGAIPLSAVARLIEPAGADTFALLDIQGKEVLGRFAENNLREGELIRIGLRPENIHLFDEQTGASLRVMERSHISELTLSDINK